VADEAECRRAALDLLARREHSRLELERKLSARGFPETSIDQALDALERSGALAAARFTASFIRTRVARGQGPVRIRAELAERGVAETDVVELLGEAGVDWAEAAIAARRKRFGPNPPRDFKERARQARFLQFRGFDSRQISAALGGRDDSD
jgi:regulatory protein